MERVIGDLAPEVMGSSLIVSVHLDPEAEFEPEVPGSILMLLSTTPHLLVSSLIVSPHLLAVVEFEAKIPGSILMESPQLRFCEVVSLGLTRPVEDGTTKAAVVVFFSTLLTRVKASCNFDEAGGGGGGGGGSGGGDGGESSRMPPSSSLVSRSRKFSSNEGSMQSIPRESEGPKANSFEKPEAKSSACWTGCWGRSGTKSNLRSSDVNVELFPAPLLLVDARVVVFVEVVAKEVEG